MLLEHTGSWRWRARWSGSAASAPVPAVPTLGRDGQLQAKEADASCSSVTSGHSLHGAGWSRANWPQAAGDILLLGRPARVDPTPSRDSPCLPMGRQAIGRRREPAARRSCGRVCGWTPAHGHARSGICIADRRLPRKGPCLRPGDRRLLLALRRPEPVTTRRSRTRPSRGASRSNNRTSIDGSTGAPDPAAVDAQTSPNPGPCWC